MRFRNGSLGLLVLVTVLLLWGNHPTPALAGFTPTPPPQPTDIPATLQPPPTSVPNTPPSPPREKKTKDTPVPTVPAPQPTPVSLPTGGADLQTTVFGIIALMGVLGIALMLAVVRLATVRNR